MRFDKILKLLICFLLIIPLLGTKASANNQYNHSELLEYEGYGDSMYESIVEQTTFITGQYTDNKEYVSNSIDEIVDYANFWKDDYENWDTSCNNDFTGCMRGMLESGGGLVLTVGDWFKNLFNSYDETVNIEQPSVSPYVSYFYGCNTDIICINEGYNFSANGFNGRNTTFSTKVSDVVQSDLKYVYSLSVQAGGYTKNLPVTKYDTREQADAAKQDILSNLNNPSYFVPLLDGLKVYNADVEVKPELTPAPLINPLARAINNYYNDNPVPEVVVPELKPTLVCPNGTQLKMSVSGSTFLSDDGTIMQVEKDGTAKVSDVICNLKWEKPKVDYVNGEPAITDSDGNWLDIEKGDVLACLNPNGCELAPVDNSLLDYVKNAYNYATGVLKGATDGLKSLATGAKDLTSLFGTFFSWLPNEMVVLMASGLGITVGLRLFRK